MATPRWIDRAREMVREALWIDADPELDRSLVSGALVVREGDHYRIETGAESWEELEHLARREAGVCDCGSLLSRRGSVRICRTCGREFQHP